MRKQHESESGIVGVESKERDRQRVEGSCKSSQNNVCLTHLGFRLEIAEIEKKIEMRDTRCGHGRSDARMMCRKSSIGCWPCVKGKRRSIVEHLYSDTDCNRMRLTADQKRERETQDLKSVTSRLRVERLLA